MFIHPKTIKVLQVITDTNIGGAGVLLLNLLDSYDRDAFEMAAVIPEGSLLKDELAKRRCAYREAPRIADRSLSLGAVRTLRDIFRDTQPDIVHTHASMSARIAARLYGRCVLIFTRHCAFAQPGYKTMFPYKTLNGAVNNYFADRIIAISPAAKENLTDTGVSPEKIVVMFNGTNPVPVLSAHEKNRIRKQYGFSDTDFICAIIARLVEVKGHAYVLDAFARLAKTTPDIKLIIAGAGPEEEKLRRKASDLRLTNCVFTGFVKDIYEIENIMQLQLNASYGTETSSLSLLEGMSLGVPAVASDFGGNPYVIRHGVNGIIVPQKNGQALADAIAALRNDAARYETLSVNSTAVFNENYTSARMAHNVEQVYRDALRLKRQAAKKP